MTAIPTKEECAYIGLAEMDYRTEGKILIKVLK
jgi:hypothetical protein